jgi:hypothetical protein
VNNSTLQLSLTPPIYRFGKSAQATTSLTPGGLLTMFGAFLYSEGNALPYPDSTPELLAYQSAVARKWNIVIVFGLLVSAVEAIWLWKRRNAK